MIRTIFRKKSHPSDKVKVLNDYRQWTALRQYIQSLLVSVGDYYSPQAIYKMLRDVHVGGLGRYYSSDVSLERDWGILRLKRNY